MATANPPIVSRAAWGANPVNTPAGTIATPTPDLWLHHTASTGLLGASGMRSLQQNAIRGGYVDLEYTVVVDPDGTIYMSRGPGRNTAATGGSTGGQSNNSRSHAICAMGNFETQTPTNALIDSIASCVLWLSAQRAIATARITGPHRDAPGNSTACCGRNLIARIGDINAIVAGGPAPGPTPPPTPTPTGGAPLTTVAQNRVRNGRRATARPIPAFGTIQLDNGASLRGDSSTSDPNVRIWANNDPQIRATNAPLLDIVPTVDGNGRPDGRGIVALYQLSGQVATYEILWS